jgi:Bardet-Biedl syndrome 1 protein
MQIETPGERVRAMRFGRFSREDNALALAMRSGAVVVKMLQRSANVGDEAGGAAVGGPPPEQDVPLPLPQKTQLYVDQTEREKEQVSESPK